MNQETTAKKEGNGGGNVAERRAQTIMLGVIMLLVGWSFNTSIDSGKDLASIKTKLEKLEEERAEQQPVINKLGADQAQLRLDLNNTTFRVVLLETKIPDHGTAH